MGKQATAVKEHTAIDLIQQHSGFIPVDVQPAATGHEVTWLNVGKYRFTKAKFEFAIRGLVATEQGSETVTTALTDLANKTFLTDALYPTGFIFHISRCGSTLLAKALARIPQHVVIDEGTPLNDGLWHYLTEGWQQPVVYDKQAFTIYRNLLLAMGRRRTCQQQQYFVKFRSWNALFIDFITQVFPDVPCLFLYRDPVEVLVSGQWKRVWTLDFKGLAPGAYMSACSIAATQAMDDLTFLAKIYRRYFAAALHTITTKLHFLNYDQLTQANYPAILAHAFDYQPTPEQVAMMQTQFAYYSKDDDDTIHFTSDKEAKQQAATQTVRQIVAQEMGDLYAQVEASERNLKRLLVG